ncbi:MAG TPA: hypothetical protein VM286_00610 [Candidatus Thermoplasmatota archaeon]|nr:hypothetical protein [Candidatus Thermoplasmatota archaeon]
MISQAWRRAFTGLLGLGGNAAVRAGVAVIGLAAASRSSTPNALGIFGAIQAYILFHMLVQQAIVTEPLRVLAQNKDDKAELQRVILGAWSKQKQVALFFGIVLLLYVIFSLHVISIGVVFWAMVWLLATAAVTPWMYSAMGKGLRFGAIDTPWRILGILLLGANHFWLGASLNGILAAYAISSLGGAANLLIDSLKMFSIPYLRAWQPGKATWARADIAATVARSSFVAYGRLPQVLVATAFPIASLAIPLAVERIARTVVSTSAPVASALLPMAAEKNASGGSKKILGVMAVLGMALGTVIFVAAPLIADRVLARSSQDVITGLRFSGLLVTLAVLNHSMFYHFFLVKGTWRQATSAGGVALLVSMLGVFLGVRYWGVLGFIGGLIAGELSAIVMAAGLQLNDARKTTRIDVAEDI